MTTTTNDTPSSGKSCRTCQWWDPADTEEKDFGGCHAKTPGECLPDGKVQTILTPANYWCRGYTMAKGTGPELVEVIAGLLAKDRDEAMDVTPTRLVARLRAAHPRLYGDATMYKILPALEQLVDEGRAVKEQFGRGKIYFVRPENYQPPEPEKPGGRGRRRSKADSQRKERRAKQFLSRCPNKDHARAISHIQESAAAEHGITKAQFYDLRKQLLADGRLAQTEDGKYYRTVESPEVLIMEEYEARGEEPPDDLWADR